MKKSMEKGKAKAWYDKDVDVLYMLFKEGPSQEVIEADPDIRIELEKGEIMGIEIWNAAKSEPNKASGKSHNRNIGSVKTPRTFLLSLRKPSSYVRQTRLLLGC